MANVLENPQYPFDPTGTASTNRVTGELQALTGAGDRDYYTVIPDATPFYAESMQLSVRTLQGDLVPLYEGIDYNLSHNFIGASRATSKPVYASITMLNRDLKGTLVFRSYQTVGGPWTISPAKASEILGNLVYNPRTIAWEQVAGYPSIFPPIPHEWNLVDMVGMAQIQESLSAIQEAILQQATSEVTQHIHDKATNPHGITPGMIGAVSEEELDAKIQSAIQQATGDTDHIREGENHLFFTTERVLQTLLAGYTVTQNAALSETDKVIEAFGKIQAQLNAIKTTLGTKVNSDQPYFTGMTSEKLEKLIMNGSFSIDLKKASSYQVLIKNSGAIGFNNAFLGDMTDRVFEFAITTVNDASGNAYAISWPANVEWVEGAPPKRSTGPNAKDYWYFVSEDGGATYSGSLSNQNPH